MRCKCYIRYCDDTVGMAKTKAEAWRQVREFIRLSDEAGLVVKANFIVSKLATNEKAKKHRWRQRGGKRHSDRLPGVPILPRKNSSEEVN